MLFATGNEYRTPFLDEALLTWKQGHPEFYLIIFLLTLQDLVVIGFVEFTSVDYQRFDEIA